MNQTEASGGFERNTISIGLDPFITDPIKIDIGLADGNVHNPIIRLEKLRKHQIPDIGIDIGWKYLGILGGINKRDYKEIQLFEKEFKAGLNFRGVKMR